MENNTEEPKKIWEIAKVVIIIVVILGLLIALIIKTVNNSRSEDPTTREEQKETGAFKKAKYENNGVLVNITSTNAGHPENGSKFTTYFKIKNEDNGTENYRVDYLDVEEWQNNATSLQVNINEKELIYFEGEGLSSVDMYYIIPDLENKALHIKVTGISIFDKNGQQCKCMPTIDKELLESKELAGILNFETSLID